MKIYLARMTPDNPLSASTKGFNTNLVYSFLLKCARFGKTATAYEIAKGCDLPQDYSVKSALALLASLDMVEQVDGKWQALPPMGGWYVPRKESGEHWADGFAYFQMAISYSFLTTKQNAIYWAIASRPNQRQCWYGMVLGIAASTTTRTINKLRRMGLVSQKGYCINPNTPAKYQDIWRKTAKVKSEKTYAKPVFAESMPEPQAKPEPTPAPAKIEKPVFDNEKSDFIEKTEWKFWCKNGMDIFENWRQPLANLAEALKKKNYSESDCIEVANQLFSTIKIWQNEQAYHEIFNCMQKIFSYAEAKTKENRASSKFFGPNSKGILLSEIKAAQEQMKTAMQNKDAESNVLLWEYTTTNIAV